MSGWSLLFKSLSSLRSRKGLFEPWIYVRFQRAQEALYIARQTSSRCFPLCRNKLPIQEQEKNDLPEILDVLAWTGWIRAVDVLPSFWRNRYWYRCFHYLLSTEAWDVTNRQGSYSGQTHDFGYLVKNSSGWRSANAFLYLFRFHSLRRLTSFLSQNKDQWQFDRPESDQSSRSIRDARVEHSMRTEKQVHSASLWIFFWESAAN